MILSNRLLIRDLARNGMRISALGIHLAAVAMITDKEGRRTGFLKDGKILEEIPDSKAAISRESKYILYPADLEVKVKFEATGEGTLTLEMIHTKGDLVQDMSYKDLVLTQKTVGEMDFTNQKPALRVDSDGSGNFNTRSADRFEEFQAIRPATSTSPVILSFTSSPLTPAPPTATPPPVPGGLAGLEWMDVGSYLVWGTSGLLVGIGVANNGAVVRLLPCSQPVRSASTAKPYANRSGAFIGLEQRLPASAWDSSKARWNRVSARPPKFCLPVRAKSDFKDFLNPY